MSSPKASRVSTTGFIIMSAATTRSNCAKADKTATTPRLWIGLSSIHWREAWKYGERAFRYCQHDLGHAIGALAYAAAALGFSARLIDGLDSAAIAQTLGLDRKSDFLRAEAEEADLLLEIFPTDEYCEAAPPNLSEGVWTGQANLLDRHPMYRWPIIDEAAAATKGAGIEIFGGAPPLPPIDAKPISADILLQRRSAQHFDPKGVMPAAHFFKMLDALLLRPQTPWSVWSFRPRLHPVLFVHRVEGLAPGLYALPRSVRGLSAAETRTRRRFPVGED